MVRRFPSQPFVLDHAAKPPIREQTLSPWRERIQKLAAFSNVLCKVSGLVTEAARKQWSPQDFQPFLEVLLETFGVDRLMYGSDWPVCLLCASYQQVFALVDRYAQNLTGEQRVLFFGGNAARLYGARIGIQSV